MQSLEYFATYDEGGGGEEEGRRRGGGGRVTESDIQPRVLPSSSNTVTVCCTTNLPTGLMIKVISNT